MTLPEPNGLATTDRTPSSAQRTTGYQETAPDIRRGRKRPSRSADSEPGPRSGVQQTPAAADAVGDVLGGRAQGLSDALVRPVLHDEAEDLQLPVGQAAQIRRAGNQNDAAQVVVTLAGACQHADPQQWSSVVGGAR
jgi:hypothetical protein